VLTFQHSIFTNLLHCYLWLVMHMNCLFQHNIITNVDLAWSFNPQTMSLLEYPKVIPYTKFGHFGIIRFWVMLRTNRQTDKQTKQKNGRTRTPVWFSSSSVFPFSLFVCLSVCPQHNSKTNDPKVSKLGTGNVPWDILEVTWFGSWMIKVRVRIRGSNSMSAF